MGSTMGRLRGGPPNNAASKRSSSHSGPSGHVILAVSARCKYSCAVPRPIEQLRAICRSPRPTSNFNRRTSLILRTDNLLAGKLILPFEGRLPAIVLSSATTCLWKSFRRRRTQLRDRPETVRLHPGTGVHFHPGILFGINPEHRSESSRNRVHLAPDSPVKGESRLPVILSQEEVQRLIDAAPTLTAHVILTHDVRDRY